MTQRRRRLSRSLAAVMVALSLTFSLVGAVAAHHADVTADMDCDGLVTYTVTAWEGETDEERTNPDIGVWVQVDDGEFVEQPSGAFNVGNGFQFSGTYSAPGAASVTVKAEAQANWANGATGPGDHAIGCRQGLDDEPVDCEANPQAEGCEPPPVDCEENPQAEGCEPPPVDCEETPEAEGCEGGEELPATGTPGATLPSTTTDDGPGSPPSDGSLPLLLILLVAGTTGLIVLSPLQVRRRR